MNGDDRAALKRAEGIERTEGTAMAADRRERSPSSGTGKKENDGEKESYRERDEKPRGRSPIRHTADVNNDAMMLQMMGFGSFESTKGKKVEGTDHSGVKKKKKAKFRQYMNREKGFNRPLSPDRSKPKRKPDKGTNGGKQAM